MRLRQSRPYPYLLKFLENFFRLNSFFCSRPCQGLLAFFHVFHCFSTPVFGFRSLVSRPPFCFFVFERVEVLQRVHTGPCTILLHEKQSRTCVLTLIQLPSSQNSNANFSLHGAVIGRRIGIVCSMSHNGNMCKAHAHFRGGTFSM